MLFLSSHYWSVEFLNLAPSLESAEILKAFSFLNKRSQIRPTAEQRQALDSFVKGQDTHLYFVSRIFISFPASLFPFTHLYFLSRIFISFPASLFPFRIFISFPASFISFHASLFRFPHLYFHETQKLIRHISLNNSDTETSALAPSESFIDCDSSTSSIVQRTAVRSLE